MGSRRGKISELSVVMTGVGNLAELAGLIQFGFSVQRGVEWRGVAWYADPNAPVDFQLARK